MHKRSDPHKVLGINKYSTKDDIRLAYKRLMKQHHPDSGDGDVKKLDEAREAYTYLIKTPAYTENLVITVPATHAELASFLGTAQTFEYEGILFEVFVPYETRMNDTITVKDILPDTTLKIKFKEKNE